MTEADTCRKFVVPALQQAGWDSEPHSIAEQRTIADGRIIPVGKGFIRKPPKRADYLLCYQRNFPLGVVEAKGIWKTAGDGLQQAKDYPDYVCRVTSDEGDIGRGHLGRFQDVDTTTPTILTTSQLLTTGVDAPTCKNVVLSSPCPRAGRTTPRPSRSNSRN